MSNEEDLRKTFGSAAVAASRTGQGADREVVWLPGRKVANRSRFRGHGEVPGRGAAQYAGRGEQTASAVSTWVYDDKKRAQIIEYMRKQGYPVATMTGDDVAKVWEMAVKQASFAYMASGKKLQKSPWDILAMNSPEGKGEKRGPYMGQSFSRTSTATTVDDVAPEQARAVLRKAFSDALGRAPEDEDEVDDFAARISRLASENPEIASTTSKYVWDQAAEEYVQTATDTKRTGGITAEMVQARAEEDAKDAPDYEAAQAAQFYMPALMQAMKSPVPGV